MTTDFTIKLAEDRGKEPSDIETIGEALRALSLGLANMPATAFHRTSTMQDFDLQEADWPDQAADQANRLFNALSFRIHAADGTTEEFAHNDSAVDKKVRDRVKLVFVFEDEGQMVVPIPHETQITRGIAKAPLRLPAVYAEMVNRDIIEALLEGLDVKAEEAGSELNNVFVHHRAHYEAMVAALRAYSDELMENAELNKEPIFYQQLGDYSVRQCGH